MDHDNEDDLRPWQIAMEKFLAAGFKPGEVIPHAWFYAALGIEMPKDQTPMVEADKLRLRYMDGMEALKAALLEEKAIYLESSYGEGYLWVPSREQADRGLKRLLDGVSKNVRQGTSIISNVDTLGLTMAEVQRHRDLKTHAATIARMNKSERRKGRELLRKPKIHEEPQAETA